MWTDRRSVAESLNAACVHTFRSSFADYGLGVVSGLGRKEIGVGGIGQTCPSGKNFIPHTFFTLRSHDTHYNYTLTYVFRKWMILTN